jgi:NHS family xanthosine MFS transporter
MNIKLRIHFFQFLFGVWLISLEYMGQTFGPIEGGEVLDELTDLWAGDICLPFVGADYIAQSFRFLPIYSGIAIYLQTQATNSTEMYWVIFATSCFYMPTIAL